MAHEWIVATEGQTLAQLVTAQEALGNTVLLQDADNSRVLVDAPSGSSGLANAVVYKGATDCSGNPNYPAASAGDMYIVSVSGKIGGASGVSVEAGDSFICKTDGTAAGTQAQRGASWNVVQGNLAGTIVDGTGAGGVLSGTFPNPGFSVNMATQAELDATVATIPVKASGAEVDSGVDDAKFVTALALTNSDYIKEADLPAGGITNSAGNNVVPKSDGTNLVASQISDSGSVVSITREAGTSLTMTGASSSIGLTAEDAGSEAQIDLETPDGGLQLKALDTAASMTVSSAMTDGFTLNVGAQPKFTLAQNPSNDWSIGYVPSDSFIDSISGNMRLSTGGGVIQIGDPADQGSGHFIELDEAAGTFSFKNTNGTDPDTTFFQVFGGVATIQQAYRLTPLAFAALPASPAEGMMAWVNDSNTAVWGATVAAGGTDKVLVVYNGVSWTVAGK